MKITRRPVPLVLFAALMPRPGCALQEADPVGPVPGYAFVDAAVVTMGDAGVLERHTVVVRGDTIIAVGPSGAVEVPPGFERIDASGRFLMPGLVDAHVHLSGHANLLANLRYGVTSVLQMSGQRGDIVDFLALRDEIDRGETIGPRIFLTGPMFDRLGLTRQTTAYAIPSADDVPRVLRDHVAAGYDFVKVHNFTPHDVYRTLVATSPVPVVGHIPLGMSVDEVIGAQAMLAHSGVLYYALFYDWSCTDGPYQCMADTRPDVSVIDDVVERVAVSGVAVTANLAYLATERSNDDDWDAVLADPEFRYLDPAMQARWRVDNPNAREGGERELRRQAIENEVDFDRELVARLSARGVPVLAGTDAGVEGLFPGRAIHLELRELVTAGLTPGQALATATSTPGRFFRRHVPRSRDLGRVEEGFVADLILLDADPLADIANVARLRGTMSRGVWHPVEALDARRAGATGP